MKKLFTTLLLSLFLLPSFAQEEDHSAIHETLEALQSAFRTKDMNLLTSVLSPNFSVSVSSLPGAMNYLEPLMDANVFEAATLVTLDQADRYTGEASPNYYAQVKIKGTKIDPEELTTIAFDKDGKLLYADYFDRLFGTNRQAKSRLVARLPFTFEHDHIVLTLRLNASEKPLKFLFDSGADGMAIRKELAEELGLTESHSQNANIVGGQTQIAASSNNTVHLTDSFSLSRQNISLFETINNFDGIIGLNLAQRHVIRVDNQHNIMYLYSHGDYYEPEQGEIIPIKVPKAVAWIPVTINLTGDNDVTGNFVFDTGASFHLIAFSEFVQRNALLQSGFQPESYGTTISMGHATPIYNGKAFMVTLTPHISYFDLPITLQAASTNPATRQHIPDGSLGIAVLRNFNFTIDLLKKYVQLQKIEQ